MTRPTRWRASAAFAFLAPALVAGFALAVVATSAASSHPVRADSSVTGDPNRGSTIFSQNCTSCHGAGLEGGVGPALHPIQKLSGVSNPLDPGYLAQTITNGRPASDGFSAAMPAKGGNSSLSAQDVQDLVAYIIQVNRTTGPTAYGPRELAVSDVEIVTLGILLMVLLTWMLARYNMRWIDRRAAARRGRLPGGGAGH